MRGVKCMVCDTSVVDPDKGVSYRGRPIGSGLFLTGEWPARTGARPRTSPQYVPEANNKKGAPANDNDKGSAKIWSSQGAGQHSRQTFPCRSAGGVR